VNEILTAVAIQINDNLQWAVLFHWSTLAVQGETVLGTMATWKALKLLKNRNLQDCNLTNDEFKINFHSSIL